MAKEHRNTLFVLVMIVIIGISVFFFLLRFPTHTVPNSIHDPEKRFYMEDKARETWATIVVGFGFFVTAFFAYRTVKATEDNVIIAQRNLRVAEENIKLLERNAEQGVQLELHRIAFAEKFKQAARIMECAHKLSKQTEVYFFNDQLSPNDEWTTLHVELNTFHEVIQINSWVFGSNVMGSATQLYNQFMQAIQDISQANATRDIAGHITFEALNRKADLKSQFQQDNATIVQNLAKAMADEMRVQSLRGNMDHLANG